MKLAPYAIVLMPLVLAACGPVYRTNYDLFPPANQQGQLCTANVKLMSDTCVANCQQMARSCRSPGGFSTSLGYGTGRYGSGYGYGGGYNTVLDDRDCNATQCVESCLSSARTAHVSCGGTIKEEVVCTANCPKPAAQAQ